MSVLVVVMAMVVVVVVVVVVRDVFAFVGIAALRAELLQGQRGGYERRKRGCRLGWGGQGGT